MARRKKSEVKLEDVQFVKSAGYSKLGEYVTLSAPSGQLHINHQLARTLDLSNWKQAMVGFLKNGTIILKKCGVEEPGAVLIRPSSQRGKKSAANAKYARGINVRHIVPALKSRGTLGKKYSPEIQKPTKNITLLVLKKVQ